MPNEKQFVGLDGEAVNDKYVLLSTTDAELYDPKGLKWRRIFDFLLRYAKQQVILVMFAGHYDVNMWLYHLKAEKRDEIFASEETTIGRFYKIFYVPKKFFSLTHIPSKRRVVVYDVFSFFNTSFVIATKNILGRTPKIITEQKKKRAEFKIKDIATIKRYNRLECELLVQMMNKLRKWIKPLELKLNSWHGPSALSNRFLSKYGLDDEYPDFKFVRSIYSEELNEALYRAYFGGRIEAFKLGTFEDVYQYDINSAYPFAITRLQQTSPEWYYTNRFLPQYETALYRVAWDIKSCPLGLFPFRDRNKTIFFPKRGEGWYFYPEVKFAVDHFYKDIRIKEGYYQFNYPVTILASLLPALYEQRREYKAQKNKTEYVIKIMLNSMYGKFAQTVGKPQFTNMVWAGMITSYTRAQILEAIHPHYDDCIAVSTDGILMRRKLTLPISKELGEYDEQHYQKAVVYMPGMYQLFADDSAQPRSERRRGYATLDYSKINATLNRGLSHTIPVRIFVTHNLWRSQPTAMRGKLCRFININKEFNPFSNTKRRYNFKQLKDWTKDHCDSTMVASMKSALSEIYEPFAQFDETVVEEDL